MEVMVPIVMPPVGIVAAGMMQRLEVLRMQALDFTFGLPAWMKLLCDPLP